MAGDRVPEIMSFRNFRESTATLSLEVSNYLQLMGMGVGKFVASPFFKVGGYDWQIRFYPDGTSNDESEGNASCYLYYRSQAAEEDVSTKFSLNILEKKGQEELTSHRVTKSVYSSGQYSTVSWGYPKFVDKAKHESLSQLGDGCFTILCVLTVMKELPQPPLDLPGHLEGMLRDERGMDVTFNVSGQEYQAHRFVLAARSPVFRAMLFGPMEEKDMHCFNVVDMEPFIFKKMLHYIYTESLPECGDKGGYSAAAMQHLLVAADMYGLVRLKRICEEELCEKLNAKTITTSLELADQHHCKLLKEACLKFVSTGRGRLRPRV